MQLIKFNPGDRVVFRPKKASRYNAYDRARVGEIAEVVDYSELPLIKFINPIRTCNSPTVIAVMQIDIESVSAFTTSIGRICGRCDEYKPDSEYYFQGGRVLGTCKVCRRARGNQLYAGVAI